jgi:hypothetical protein
MHGKALMLSNSFRRLRAPDTGRLVMQLTGGDGFTYPLYFYIPSITRDGRYLVYHRAAGGEMHWLSQNAQTVGSRYASELQRHYR